MPWNPGPASRGIVARHVVLCNDRTMEAAQAFFRMAVSQEGVPWPAKINVDGNSATHRGLRLLGAEDPRWRGVEVRARRYLQQCGRAGSSRHQAAVCADARLEEFSLGHDHARRH
jgi:transposase-like protein